jgi:hypothetical protein
VPLFNYRKSFFGSHGFFWPQRIETFLT